MSSADQNLSEFYRDIPELPHLGVGIAVADWNPDVTHALLDGALRVLKQAQVSDEKLVVKHVPGSFELTLAAQRLAQTSKVDVVIALGCVIQGETRHFDFICSAVAHGITNVGLKYNKPCIFGVLTPDNQQQALDRAGGKHGNKGEEAAYTALRMYADLK